MVAWLKELAMLLGRVYSNKLFVGIIYKEEAEIVFEYAQSFIDHRESYDISYSLPRSQKLYRLP